MTTNDLWAKAWAKETEGLDLNTARRAGRATKDNPNKEDGFWWDANGSIWVLPNPFKVLLVDSHEVNVGMLIATFPSVNVQQLR
jgi:hypothetical protein